MSDDENEAWARIEADHRENDHMSLMTLAGASILIVLVLTVGWILVNIIGFIASLFG